jgi:competence protein ComEA
MKRSAIAVPNKQLLFALMLLITAVILLVFSLMEPKREAAGEWVALNAEVETALASFDHSNEEGEATAAAAAQTKVESSSGITDGITEENTGEEIGVNKVEAALEQAEVGSKLDINRATAAELDDLKGIGPAKAKAIVQDRDQNGKFSSVNDLLRVKGIGEKLLQGIEESIVARP